MIVSGIYLEKDALHVFTSYGESGNKVIYTFGLKSSFSSLDHKKSWKKQVAFKVYDIAEKEFAQQITKSNWYIQQFIFIIVKKFWKLFLEKTPKTFKRTPQKIRKNS